ncbi:MAG TPA: hypothetical protein VLC29_05900, partial [Rhizomicrobium sp.]|nr:hypothetical protein [Rhizomicrobium sp.]
MTQLDCPVCGQPNTPLTSGNAVPTVKCKRCGDFAPTGTAFELAKIWGEGKNSAMNPRGKYAVSHAIRKMQHTGRRPEISSDMLRVLWNQPRLNPQQQANEIVIAIGEADLPLNEYVYISNDAMAAVAGTEDDVWKGKSGGLH